MSKNIEDWNQIFIATFCRKLQKQEDFIFFSVPNGGSRNKAEASKLKMTGLLAGIPDLCFICNGKMFFIELKTSIGSTSKVQDEVIAKLDKHKIKTYIIHGDKPEEEEPERVAALRADLEPDRCEQLDRVEHGEEEHRCDRRRKERNPDDGRNSLGVTAPFPCASVLLLNHRADSRAYCARLLT